MTLCYLFYAGPVVEFEEEEDEVEKYIVDHNLNGLKAEETVDCKNPRPDEPSTHKLEETVDAKDREQEDTTSDENNNSGADLPGMELLHNF